MRVCIWNFTFLFFFILPVSPVSTFRSFVYAIEMEPTVSNVMVCVCVWMIREYGALTNFYFIEHSYNVCHWKCDKREKNNNNNIRTEQSIAKLNCYFQMLIRKINRERDREMYSYFISCGICESITNIYLNWDHSLASSPAQSALVPFVVATTAVATSSQ